MIKLKIGDNVLIDSNDCTMQCKNQYCVKIGKGKIIKNGKALFGIAYCVDFGNGHNCWFYANELTKVK